ncbi:hypothetical protein PHLCEN_2v8938 [Hermanssonia centrifuga]|uniref:Uncharacterized protein n=2 Tax=Hermanssonia centrifuga TaxID=98765 RepID=A0A2R6NS00_9APHY|nr:hypothetical protein PHLCEN_2v8938 [Hermanssonia centrifuga]
MSSALLIMNISQVLVRTLPLFESTSPVPTIVQTLTPILISRFLLNLRQLTDHANDTNSALVFNSRFTVPGFRVPTLSDIVGNLGEDLDHGPVEAVDDALDQVEGGAVNQEATVKEDPDSYFRGLTIESHSEIEEIPRRPAV